MSELVDVDPVVAGFLARGVIVSELRCPICTHPVAAAAKTFPFCSERCRLVDLGKWLREDYRVSRPLSPGAPAEESGESDASSPEDPDDAGG